jgi:two-component system nitrate/nitrite response regulator NarL
MRSHRCDHRGVAASVLLVDDDLTFRSLATRILKSLGFDVVATAHDAAAAIAAANALRPEAALVDVGLPDRDGVDLASELAALPWHPRVVLTSTDWDTAAFVEAAGEGCALPFIPKEELPTAPLRRLLTAE